MRVTHEITLLISVWCLVFYVAHSIPSRSPNGTTINLAVSPSWSRQNSSNISSIANSFEKLCVLKKFPIQKPKRVAVSFRKDAGFVNGCINEQVIRSPIVDDLVMVIHLNQKNYDYDMNIKVRIIPPLEGFTGRLTIVLYSSNASKWLLDLYDLLAVNPNGQHRVVLSNSKSSFYSEQMHADKHLTVQYLDDAPDSKNLNNWENFYQLLMNRSFGPITLLVSHSSMDTRSENYAVNMISIQLSNLLKFDKTVSSRESQCVMAPSDRLKKFVDVWLESEGDIGFASCRSHKWEDENQATPKRLLEIVEMMTNRNRDRNGFEMRLVAPSKDTPGSAAEIVLAVFSTQSYPILLDVQSVHREVLVLSNQEITVYPFDKRAASRLTFRHLRGISDITTFHESLYTILGPLSGWSVERLTLRPLMDTIPHPVYLSIRLHEAPLLLQDLESWLLVACFDTRDVEVKVPRRPFRSMGLNKSQVLLGGNPKCSLHKNEDKWVRKILLRSRDPCTILDQDLGNQYQIKSKLSLVTSDLLLPYSLNFVCMARREPGVDLPPQNQQNNPDFLWRIYNKVNRTYEPRTSDNLISSIGRDFKLELFRDKDMTSKIDSDSVPVVKNQRLYGRVEPSSQGVQAGLMIRDCMLAGPSPLYGTKQYILHHGCEMGAYFRWEEADSFRIKTFSFELPRPSFFGSDGFYLHCFIQPCNYFEKQEALPRCWNQRYICYFPQTPGPLQLRAGPFPYTPLPQSRRSGLEIPLWGALLIATIALILGMGVAGLLWLIHHFTRRRRNTRAVRRPVHHSPVCEPSCVLLRMNPSRLEQERRHLLHNGSFPLTIGTPNGI